MSRSAGGRVFSRRPVRRGVASILVSLLTLVALGVLSFAASWMIVQSSQRRAEWLRSDVEHMYLAEAVFANAIGRLKRTSWDFRPHAQGKDSRRCQSELVVGTHAGDEFSLVVSDVPGSTGQPTPDLVDLLLRTGHRGTMRSYVCRVKYGTPTIHRPSPYRIVRVATVSQDPLTASGRAAIAAFLNAEASSRIDNAPFTNVISREFRRQALSPANLSAASIIRQLAQTDFGPRVALEKTAIEALALGDQALEADGKAPDYEAARLTFEQAKAAAQTQSGNSDDQDANYPRALYGLAKARIGLAEALANSPTDDTVADRAARTGHLNLAASALNELRTGFADSPIVPLAILQQARIDFMLKPDRTGRAAALARLDGLKRYPGWHLWGGDRPVLSRTPANSVLNLFKLAYSNLAFCVERAGAPGGSWNVWGVAIHGEKDRRALSLTVLPDLDWTSDANRESIDLVTPSWDGSKVGFRVFTRIGLVAGEKVFTMDLDGSNLHDISDKAVGSFHGWEPPWFRTWKADPSALRRGVDTFRSAREATLISAPLARTALATLGQTLQELSRRLDCSAADRPKGLVQILGPQEPLAIQGRTFGLDAVAKVLADLGAFFGQGQDLSAGPPARVATVLGLDGPAAQQWDKVQEFVVAAMEQARQTAGAHVPAAPNRAEALRRVIDCSREAGRKVAEAIRGLREGRGAESLKKALESRLLASDPPVGGRQNDQDVAPHQDEKGPDHPEHD